MFVNRMKKLKHLENHFNFSEVTKAQSTSPFSQQTTIFDKIVSKQIPADILFEDEQALAFRDIKPQAPTHILIIPKRRITMLQEMKQEDKLLIGHLMWVATQIATQQGLLQGYRVVINNGKEGCQSVYHLHLHLLGGKQLGWPPC